MVKGKRKQRKVLNLLAFILKTNPSSFSMLLVHMGPGYKKNLTNLYQRVDF